jgi:hypothetical protein
MRMSRRVAVVVGALASATVLAAGSASASTTLSSSTTGSYAQYTTGAGWMWVCDTKADGDSPYVWWNPNTSHHQPTNRYEIHSGNGTCQQFPVATDSSGYISFQACRDVPNNPDNCGAWVTMRY